MWAKKSTSAGLYRGEILGGVMMQLILYAAASSYYDTISPVMVDCDNNGAMIHRNNSVRSLPTNQSQVDLLQVCKHLVSSQPFRVQYEYVAPHSKDAEQWQIVPSNLPLIGILLLVLITLDGIVSWKAVYLSPH